MQVRDCMTAKVELTDPNASLVEAAQKMRSGDFGVLPVGEGDRLIGMITDRDIAVRCVAEGRDPTNMKVGDAMTRKVLYCYDDQLAREAGEIMVIQKVRRLPVLSRGKRLVGIVSLGDLAKWDSSVGIAGNALREIAHRSSPPVAQAGAA
jgi:CBS domain-containing protein